MSLELVANRLDRRYDSERTKRMDCRAALRIRAWSKEKRADTDRITEEKPDQYKKYSVQHKKSLSLRLFHAAPGTTHLSEYSEFPLHDVPRVKLSSSKYPPYRFN